MLLGWACSSTSSGARPLGLWPLSLLAVYGVVLAGAQLLAGQDVRMLFAWYAACTVLAFMLAYLIVSLLDAATRPAFWPCSGKSFQLWLLFPVADWLIERFEDADVRFR